MQLGVPSLLVSMKHQPFIGSFITPHARFDRAGKRYVGAREDTPHIAGLDSHQGPLALIEPCSIELRCASMVPLID